jgi:hypothetical protein
VYSCLEKYVLGLGNGKWGYGLAWPGLAWLGLAWLGPIYSFWSDLIWIIWVSVMADWKDKILFFFAPRRRVK